MPSRKNEKDEVMETGRIFGNITRTAPELWEYLERESMITGRKKHEIMQEALSRMIIEREVILKGLTMEQILAAWDLKDRLELMMMRKIFELGVTIFGTLFTQVGSLVGNIRTAQEEAISQIVEQEKKKDIEYQMKKTQARMAATLLEMMMPTLMSTLRQIMPLTSATQPQQPQQKKQPEVEVIE